MWTPGRDHRKRIDNRIHVQSLLILFAITHFARYFSGDKDISSSGVTVKWSIEHHLSSASKLRATLGAYRN